MGLVLDSTKKLKKHTKQTFLIKNGSKVEVRHTLLINPEDMSVNEPAKVTVTETLGGGYVSDFGSGFKQVVLTGITGYKARYNADGELRDGYTELKHLRTSIYRKFIESSNKNYAMYWYNWEDEEYYRIQPMNFRVARNKSEPTLYRYEFQFTCLQRLASVKDKKAKFNSEAIAKLNMMETGGKLAAKISSLSEIKNKL